MNDSAAVADFVARQKENFMDLFSRRAYRGPVKLAVFDWAGTTVDHGCMAPAAVFVEGYRRKGVEITMAQARAPMGMEKRAHIEAIAAMPPVAARWQETHGRPIQPADLDALYEDFVPSLLAALERHSGVIPGTVEACRQLRDQGVRIGASTGYFEEAMAVVQRAAAAQGYTPDFSVAATQVPMGRPAPWMIYRVMEALRIYPPQAVVAIGDTRVDVEAGLNAGVWTIAVAMTGNEVGLTADELAALPETERQARRAHAYATLTEAGAHFVVDGIWDVPAVAEEINRQLRQGLCP
jgi:phosphonoacetaldehyde hydrolase